MSTPPDRQPSDAHMAIRDQGEANTSVRTAAGGARWPVQSEPDPSTQGPQRKTTSRRGHWALVASRPPPAPT